MRVESKKKIIEQRGSNLLFEDQIKRKRQREREREKERERERQRCLRRKKWKKTRKSTRKWKKGLGFARLGAQ